MRLPIVLLLVLLCGAAPAAAQDAEIADGSAQRALDDARSRWAAAGIRDYAYTSRVSCFCTGNGEPRETIVHSDASEDGTIERLFATIQRYIDEKPYEYSATYGEHGVPTVVSFDRWENVADDFGGFTVENFQAIEPAGRRLADARAAWKTSGVRRHSVVVTRSCPRRPDSVRRGWTVPRLHAFVARHLGIPVRYGRHGIPRDFVFAGCVYAVTRFRRGR